MKKLVISMMLVAMATMLTTQNTHAQTAPTPATVVTENGGGSGGNSVSPQFPDSIPAIMLRGTMRSMALERSKLTSASLWSQSKVPDGGRSSIWAGTPEGFRPISQLLRELSKPLIIKVTNPQDIVWYSVALYDTNGYATYFVGKYIQPEWSELGSPHWQFPAGAEKIQFEFNDYESVQLFVGKGLCNVFIRLYDKSGKTDRTVQLNYDPNLGTVWFQLVYTERAGELVLDNCGGGQRSYSLQNGEQIVPESIGLAPDVSFRGVISTNWTPRLNIKLSVNDVSPIVEMLCDANDDVVFTDVSAYVEKTGELARGIWLRRIGAPADEQPMYFGVNPAVSKYIRVKMVSGNLYHYILDWETFDPVQPLPEPCYGCGAMGGGGGAVPVSATSTANQ